MKWYVMALSGGLGAVAWRLAIMPSNDLYRPALHGDKKGSAHEPVILFGNQNYTMTMHRSLSHHAKCSSIVVSIS